MGRPQALGDLSDRWVNRSSRARQISCGSVLHVRGSRRKHGCPVLRDALAEQYVGAVSRRRRNTSAFEIGDRLQRVEAVWKRVGESPGWCSSPRSWDLTRRHNSVAATSRLGTKLPATLY